MLQRVPKRDAKPQNSPGNWMNPHAGLGLGIWGMHLLPLIVSDCLILVDWCPELRRFIRASCDPQCEKEQQQLSLKS